MKATANPTVSFENMASRPFFLLLDMPSKPAPIKLNPALLLGCNSTTRIKPMVTIQCKILTTVSTQLTSLTRTPAAKPDCNIRLRGKSTALLLAIRCLRRQALKDAYLTPL